MVWWQLPGPGSMQLFLSVTVLVRPYWYRWFFPLPASLPAGLLPAGYASWRRPILPPVIKALQAHWALLLFRQRSCSPSRYYRDRTIFQDGHTPVNNFPVVFL